MTSGEILYSFRSCQTHHVPFATVFSDVLTLEDAKLRVADSKAKFWDNLQSSTHLVRVIIERGATWRGRNSHLVFLDQFFMLNKNI